MFSVCKFLDKAKLINHCCILWVWYSIGQSGVTVLQIKRWMLKGC